MTTHADPLSRIPINAATGSAETTTDACPNWIANASLLLRHRKFLTRFAGVALLLNLLIAFLIPKQFQSTARIMPPESQGTGTALLAALAGRAMGSDGLGGLAASLLGGHNTGALFIDLLHSATVTDHLIDRFQLQAGYHKKYRIDAAKELTRRTRLEQDKKSGVITITVTDEDPQRAHDMAQEYLDTLNLLVNRTNTSSARRERIFIENRLASVRAELDHAQKALSEFSSTNLTIDLREQTRATVDAAAKLQGELVVTQGELSSLQQIYGDGNVRVRAAQARAANLKSELEKLGGKSTPIANTVEEDGDPSLVKKTFKGLSYPALRQIPRLAVPYENLYRNARIQETVLDLLTQQYEIAQIQEAKDIPILSVIDSPSVPEKKSFPPRALLTLALTLAELLFASGFVLAGHYWRGLSLSDPRRVLAREVAFAIAHAWPRMSPVDRGSS